jgi:hypothetical protein
MGKPKNSKGGFEEEEPQGPSKKELRAQKKAQKQAALEKLKDSKADQDRMLSTMNIKSAMEQDSAPVSGVEAS